MSTAVVQQLLSGLRSKNRDEQNRSAQELLLFAKTELREMQQDELNQFFDEFNHQTFDMLLSSDNNEKKGGVLAISEYFFSRSIVL
jgi:FKBP12-rapamycin complex-associated protein